jgi:hypothetical protein
MDDKFQVRERDSSIPIGDVAQEIKDVRIQLKAG